MDLEFTFADDPLLTYIDSLQPDTSVPAQQLLTLASDAQSLEEALDKLTENRISLDVSQIYWEGGQAAQRLSMEQKLAKKQDLIGNLGENDPLRLYLEELAATPAAGDINLLSQSLLEGDTQAASLLTNLCLSRVVSISREMTGKGVLILDLIQEGSLGLWRSIQTYTGGNFEDHCDWWIRQSMAAFITLQAADSGLGQRLRQSMEDYQDVDQKLLTELGRNPTIEEIAEGMHLTLPQAQMVESMVLSARLVAIAHAKQEEPEETPEDRQAVEDTAYFQSRQRIFDMISGLSDTEKQLITLRYGLDSGTPMSAQQVAERMGLSCEEVTAMEAKALEKMRNKR